MPSGHDAIGIGRVPLLEEPIVPGAHAGETELWILRASQKSVPPKPVTPDGKFTDAQMPSMSMSLMRSSIRKQPGRTSSKRAGSTRWSSRARPATHMKPTWK